MFVKSVHLFLANIQQSTWWRKLSRLNFKLQSALKTVWICLSVLRLSIAPQKQLLKLFTKHFKHSCVLNMIPAERAAESLHWRLRLLFSTTIIKMERTDNQYSDYVSVDWQWPHSEKGGCSKTTQGFPTSIQSHTYWTMCCYCALWCRNACQQSLAGRNKICPFSWKKMVSWICFVVITDWTSKKKKGRRDEES